MLMLYYCLILLILEPNAYFTIIVPSEVPIVEPMISLYLKIPSRVKVKLQDWWGLKSSLFMVRGILDTICLDSAHALNQVTMLPIGIVNTSGKRPSSVMRTSKELGCGIVVLVVSGGVVVVVIGVVVVVAVVSGVFIGVTDCSV